MSIRSTQGVARSRAYRFNTQRPSEEKKTYWGCHFADESKVLVRKLCWTKPDGRSATTIRILPGTDSETASGWGPYRLSSEPLDFGDWIRSYTMCRIGQKAVTFITHDPVTDPDYDIFENPARLVWSGVKKAVDTGCDQPGWAAMLKGSPGRAAILPPPKPLYLVRCLVIEHGAEQIAMPQGLGPQDKIVLMDLGKGAGERTCKLLSECAEGTENDEDPQYLVPDPIAIDGGVFFRYFPLEQDPRNVRQAATQPRSFASRAKTLQAPADKKSFEDVGFGVYTLDHLESGEPAALTEYSDDLLKKMPEWEDFLVFLSEEQQARLVAERFDLSVLDYCWRDHPDFLSIARDVHSKRVNVPAQTAEESEEEEAPTSMLQRSEERRRAATAVATPSASPAQRPWTPPDDEFAESSAAATVQRAKALSDAERAALAEGKVAPDTAAIAEKQNKLAEAKQRFAQRHLNAS